MIFYNKSSMIEDENTSIDDISILCLEMEHRLVSEQYLPTSPIVSAPSFNSSRLFHFPYRYSQWNSSSKIPRLLTPCEHNLVMNLLMIIDRICRQNEIIYFIYEGTLLGSLRHHDIIPWDEDVDIIISYDQGKQFENAFKQLNQTLLEFHLFANKNQTLSYYKIYYNYGPNAGKKHWHFPFVDIFLYTTNTTHLWNLGYSEVKLKMEDVFPLILRPLGRLWVPAPRKSERLFQFDPFDKCITHSWDHRNEIGQTKITMDCNDLKDIYPFVEQSNKTDFIEILKINNTIIHTVILK